MNNQDTNQGGQQSGQYPVRPSDGASLPVDTVPEEIKYFNWGAFLLTFFWAIAHRLWVWVIIYLFIPCGQLIISLILGFKGNEYVWKGKTREFASIEEFNQVQKIWTKWGIIILIISVILTFIAIIASIIIAIIFNIKTNTSCFF